MPATASGQAKMLVRTVLTHLEKSPVEFVEALIDLLAAPGRKREGRLLQALILQVWLLLESKDSFAPSLNSGDDSYILLQPERITPYDRLIQMVCGLIELDLIRNCVPAKQSQVPRPNRKTLQLFWGGLCLHVKLSLPLEPCCGSELFSNGLVMLSDGRSLPCEPPLSESQIYALVTQLGTLFVFEYAASYIRNETLRRLISALNHQENKKGIALGELLVQERTLNRYVNKFAKHLATHLRDGCMRSAENPNDRLSSLLSSASLDSVFTQIITEASSALFIEHQKVKSPNAQKRAETFLETEESSPSSLPASIPTHESSMLDAGAEQGDTKVITGDSHTVVTRVPDTHKLQRLEILERIKRVQEKVIRDSTHSIFVVQDLDYYDPLNEITRAITIDEVVGSTNRRLVLAAPPDGGKTRLQQEIVLRARDPNIYHLWIDLKKFPTSGFRSFHRFAANQVLNMLERNREPVIKLEEDLLALDLDRKVCWHLDGWDMISKSDRPSVATTLIPISQFTFSTSNPNFALEVFKTQETPFSGVISIQLFTAEQIREFVRANSTTQTINRVKVERRILQLPGHAKLPGGLEYMCTHPELGTIVDILLGYINNNLMRIGEPGLNPNELVFDGLKEVAWQSDVLTSSYLIVKAALRRSRRTSNNPLQETGIGASSKDFSQIRIDEILPYMGAGNREENRQLAMERIAKAVRGKLLQVNDDGRTYCFVVPEVGFLLAAIAMLAPYHGKRWLGRALREFQQDTWDPIHQMALALGAWHQEKLLLRDFSLGGP